MDEKIAADSGRQSWYFCIDLKSNPSTLRLNA